MKQTFEPVAASLTDAFKVNLAESEATTALDLVETVRQFLDGFEQIDIEYGDDKKIIYHDVTLVADDAIAALAELSVWSENLELQSEKHSLDQLSLDVAQWAMRHGGTIHTLAPIANCFAHRANQTQDSNALVGLLHEMRAIIEHAADPIKADTDELDPFRPWKILNLNYAIVATRTQLPELMTVPPSSTIH